MPAIYLKYPASCVASVLKSRGIKSGHFADDTFPESAQDIPSAILSGFQYAVDNAPKGDKSALILAMGSDKSQSHNKSEMVRAVEIAEPLVEKFPDRKVVVLFFDEKTPEELYNALATNGFGMESLFNLHDSRKTERLSAAGSAFFKRLRAHVLPPTRTLGVQAKSGTEMQPTPSA
jgi:hypothetical protein